MYHNCDAFARTYLYRRKFCFMNWANAVFPSPSLNILLTATLFRIILLLNHKSLKRKIKTKIVTEFYPTQATIRFLKAVALYFHCN